MSSTSPSAIVAKLIVISDFPIDEELLTVVRQLWTAETTERDLVFGSGRKWCEWPCRVPDSGGDDQEVGFQIYLCATFLVQRRKIVERIRQLGCNIELCLYIAELSKYFSIASATMKQLSDLDIQLSFHPL